MCVARVYVCKCVCVFIYVHGCVGVRVFMYKCIYLSGEFHVELIMNFRRNVEVFLEGGGI